MPTEVRRPAVLTMAFPVSTTGAQSIERNASTVCAYGTCERTSNIQPGEIDYPVINSNAEHPFRVSGTADPRLHFQLFLTRMPSNKTCRYATSIAQGADALYRVDEAVEPVRHASEYEVVTQTDRMVP